MLYDVDGKVASNKKIHNAVLMANVVISNQEFLFRVSQVPGFWNINVSGGTVARNIELHSRGEPDAKLVLMSKWKTARPWYRNVTAETSKSVVALNPRFFDRPIEDVVNTLVHEWLHTLGYSHIWNNRKKYPEILKSVPYAVGQIAEDVCKGILNGNIPSMTYETLANAGSLKEW